MISKDSSFLAIVPARANSKGIAKKNLVPVAGQPLIYWTLSALSQARNEVRVVVSTDDMEVASIAETMSCEIIWRPKNLAEDWVASESVMKHALENIQSPQKVSAVGLYQPTSPVRKPGRVDQALDSLDHRGVNSVVAVRKIGPYRWFGHVSDAQPRFVLSSRLPRQLLSRAPSEFSECGSFYWTDLPSFARTNVRASGRTVLIELDGAEAVDIDTEEDLALVRAFMAHSTTDARCS